MGLTYLIDFLRGSKSQKIWDTHKNLKTYGVGADISKENWFDYFKDLIAQGFLKQTEGQFPTIVLTETSEDVLKGNVKVELFKVTEKEAKEKIARLGTFASVYHGIIRSIKNFTNRICPQRRRAAVCRFFRRDVDRDGDLSAEQQRTKC